MTKIISSTALAGVFALGLAATAQAQSIPTPANPTPRFPVSTDGTPLPRNNAYSGTDAFGTRGPLGAPIGGFNALVDGTVGAAGVR